MSWPGALGEAEHITAALRIQALTANPEPRSHRVLARAPLKMGCVLSVRRSSSPLPCHKPSGYICVSENK